MAIEFDLTTLNLSAGTHSITVKARASGYKDSEPSIAVSYVVARPEYVGETWHIPAGWTAAAGYGMFEISGSLNGITIEGLDIGYDVDPSDSYGSTTPKKNSIVYSYSGSAFGELTSYDGIEITITGGADATNQNLIDWLNANGKRVITFTIDGATYYAEEGMTWGEWVESEYNTGGFYVVEGLVAFDTAYGVVDENYKFVFPNETIKANYLYEIAAYD